MTENPKYTESPRISLKIREKLRAPFPNEAYSAHPTKTFLTTLKAMYITERLNDVFGIGRWTFTHVVVDSEPGYVLIRGNLMILEYMCEIPEQYGGHKTTGTNTEPADGYKSAITDCISKCASYLEIGIEMFKGNIKPPKKGSYVQPAPKSPPKQAPMAPQNEPPPGLDSPPEDLGYQNEQAYEGLDLGSWNGKIYGKGETKSIYVNNVPTNLTAEQHAALLNHPKYKSE